MDEPTKELEETLPAALLEALSDGALGMAKARNIIRNERKYRPYFLTAHYLYQLDDGTDILAMAVYDRHLGWLSLGYVQGLTALGEASAHGLEKSLPGLRVEVMTGLPLAFENALRESASGRVYLAKAEERDNLVIGLGKAVEGNDLQTALKRETESFFRALKEAGVGNALWDK